MPSEHSDRSYVHFTDVTDLRTGLRFDTDIASVSDSNYFRISPSARTRPASPSSSAAPRSSITTMPGGSAPSCRTFRPSTPAIDAGDRPVFARTARRRRTRLCPLFGHNFEFALSTARSSISCARSVRPECASNVSPELRWASRGPGYFFEPAVGYHFTQYDLQNAAVGDPEHADPGAAVREPGHRTDLRARCGLAGTAHADPRAAPRLQLHSLPQSERAAAFRHRDCPT